MFAEIASLLAVVILAGAVHDTIRLIAPRRSWRPPLPRLYGRRSAQEATERRCTDLLLRGRITPADYRTRMSRLARGENHSSRTRHGNAPREGGHD